MLIIAVSLLVAYYLFKSSSFESFINNLASEKNEPIYALIVGFFFTSAFTTAPAIATLIKMGQFTPPLQVALFGALGAVIGDSIIFFFMRDHLVKDFINTIKKPRFRRISHAFKSKIIRLSLAFLGGILIALPLPTDEAALTLMSAIKLKSPIILSIAYAFNFGAIYIMSSALS